MANQEQLDIIKQGVQVWNEWRAENTSLRIDLSSVNLSTASLSLTNLNGADLSHANLSYADLLGANLNGALQPHFLITAM